MRARRDLIWLVGIVIAVSLAVAWSPYDIRLPRPPLPVFTATPEPVLQ